MYGKRLGCFSKKSFPKTLLIHHLSLQLYLCIFGTLLFREINSAHLNFFISEAYRRNDILEKIPKHLIIPKISSKMRHFPILKRYYATNKESLRNRIIPGVSALISRNLTPLQYTREEYLIVQRGEEPSYGKWSFPGGKVEFGESLLQAIKREIQEELHLRTTDVTFTKYPFMNTDAIWFDNQSKTQIQYIIFQFYARISEAQQKPPILQADDDILDFKWQTKDQISQLMSSNLTVGELIKVIETSEKLRPYLIEVMENTN